jgi:dsRNA-specific ribonuclease
VWLGDTIAASGSGSSKQVAEQIAARTALAEIASRQQSADASPEEA